jgi:antitoxin component HigA of HigAB toxin-antitoxin module
MQVARHQTSSLPVPKWPSHFEWALQNKVLMPILDDQDYAIALQLLVTLQSNVDDGIMVPFVTSLAVLIEDYERKNFPAPEAEPQDLIAAHIMALGLSQAFVAKQANMQASHLSEVLNGQRPLSLRMIVSLSRLLKIPVAQLIPEGYDPDIEIPAPSHVSTQEKAIARVIFNEPKSGMYRVVNEQLQSLGNSVRVCLASSQAPEDVACANVVFKDISRMRADIGVRMLRITPHVVPTIPDIVLRQMDQPTTSVGEDR